MWCDATDRIRDVAQKIGDAADSCALVRGATGLAIVTDHDFRHRVATGEIGVDAPIANVATVPVISIDEDATLAAGLLRMVEHGVHHLVVADIAGQPVGVVRVADLARTEVRDPPLVRSTIGSARTLDALVAASRLLPATTAELRGQGVPAHYVGALHSAVVDAIVRRALALCASPSRSTGPLDRHRHRRRARNHTGSPAPGQRGRTLSDDEQQTLVGGFDSIYTLLYDQELRSIHSGQTPTTFVSPRGDSLTRRHLRETLRAIARVQTRVDQEWIHRLSG